MHDYFKIVIKVQWEKGKTCVAIVYICSVESKSEKILAEKKQEKSNGSYCASDNKLHYLVS